VFGKGTDRSPVNPLPLVRVGGGGAAVDLAKVRGAGHINLAKAADAAQTALVRRGLLGIRAQAVTVLDHSGSMRPDYRSGAVAALLTRVLGFTLTFDADASVPVIPFDSRVYPPVQATVDNYTTVVADRIWLPDRMGSTNLAGALAVVRDLAASTSAPLYVVVVTDGEPDDERAATKIVCDLARFPVFLKFLALRPVAYLSRLDTLDDSRRLLDNCNAKPEPGSRLDLLSCTDEAFQEAMADEWDLWIDRATKAGVLR
jgi:vWA found in TerF C terminus